MENRVNCLRVTNFYVGKTGEPFKQVMVIQELFRSSPRGMRGITPKMIDKVPRFKKWIKILEQERFFPEGTFKDKTVIVDNNFHPFKVTHEELKQKLIDKHDKTKNIDSRFPVTKCQVIDLSPYVMLESFYWSGEKTKRRVTEKEYKLLKVGDQRKPDQNDFNKLLALEAYQRDEWKEPEPPQKKWQGLTVRVLLEFAPDATSSYGTEIDELDLEYVAEGNDPQDIV